MKQVNHIGIVSIVIVLSVVFLPASYVSCQGQRIYTEDDLGAYQFGNGEAGSVPEKSLEVTNAKKQQKKEEEDRAKKLSQHYCDYAGLNTQLINAK